MGNNSKDIVFSFDDFISTISIEELEDFGSKIIIGDINMNSTFNAFAVAFKSPLVSVGCTFGEFRILVAHFIPNCLYSDIKLWDVQSGALIQTIDNLPKLTITSVGVCPDGTIIACGIREDKICAWELQTDKIIYTTDEMCPCILSENGRVLIYATANYEIVIRDLVKEQELCKLTGHQDSIAYLTLSTDYQFIASYSTDRQIKIWGIPDLNC